MADDTWPYPTMDRPLELDGGQRVQLYNIIIVSGGGPRAVGIQYASSLPRGDSGGRRREAEAVMRRMDLRGRVTTPSAYAASALTGTRLTVGAQNACD